MEHLIMCIALGWQNCWAQKFDKELLARKRKMKKGYVYLFLAMVFLIIIGIVDWKWINPISLMPFYTVPVIIATVIAGQSIGIVVSVMSVLIWLWTDLNNGYIGYHHTLTPYWNALVMLSVLLLIVGTIFLRKTLWKEKIRARIDPLTGVVNRRAFYELARKEIARSRRYCRPISLVFFDFNGFKQINDQFGHRKGDLVLHDVGKSIRKSVRNEDVAARWGGDEFIVLLPETDYAGAVRLVDRLKKAFVNIVQVEVKGVSASFGIKSYVTAPISIDEMVSAADEFMYSAKRSRSIHRLESDQQKEHSFVSL